MRALRFPLHLGVRYRLIGQRDWRQGTTENISHSGVLFRGEDSLPVAEDIELRLELLAVAAGARFADVKCRGRVVRTISPADDQPWPRVAMQIDYYHFIPPSTAFDSLPRH